MNLLKKNQIINDIVPGSIAEELGLLAGDVVVSINGNPVEDVLDYRFVCKEEYLDILIRRGNEEGVFEVEKDADEDLGIIFEDGLMDEYHSCCNKCIFCFIDQMPPNMRDTLYFKDDDERLSFLQGNYITLTNLNDEDVERIIRYRLSPINISIQTMNPELRCKMLNNRFAGDSLKILDRFYEAGIIMNAQIVLCEGINDDEELDSTIEKLSKYLPNMESVSVVPVGLTKHREGLYPLKSITKETAEETLEIVEKWQKKLFPEYGLHFIHASDEFYLMCEREMPLEDTYDGYLQYENGVGMLRLMEEEINAAINEFKDMPKYNSATIATGELAAKALAKYFGKLSSKFPDFELQIIPIKNEFFGEQITVAGLITGKDLIHQLKGNIKSDRVFITSNMLRSGENVFLDDVTVENVEDEIGAKIIPIPNNGFELVSTILYSDNLINSTYNSYEL